MMSLQTSAATLLRNASMGSMLAARRAGMKPANPAASDNTTTAIEMLTGS
jgi:hypothetical protein